MVWHRLVTTLIRGTRNVFTRSPATHYKDHNGGGASVLIRRGVSWRGASLIPGTSEPWAGNVTDMQESESICCLEEW